MPALTIEQILAASDGAFEMVPTPEWGGDVGIRRVTGTERGTCDRQRYELKEKKENWEKTKLLCVVASLCDETGKPIDVNAEQFAKLGEKAGLVIERLWNVSQRLNLWIEDGSAEKNSDSAPTSSSGT